MSTDANSPELPDRDATLGLGIDTATAPASVALVHGDATLHTVDGPGGRDTDRWIFPAIRACLDSAGVTPEELDLVAVTVGPGAFTGIRVGIATAQGISTGCGACLAGVGTLEALAEVGRHEVPEAGSYLACHDVRRRQVYAALFHLEAPEALPLGAVWGPRLCDPDELAATVATGAPERVVGIGSGFRRYPRVADLCDRLVDADGALAAAAGRVAARTFDRRGGESLPAPSPSYLRPPDVRRRTSPLTGGTDEAV